MLSAVIAAQRKDVSQGFDELAHVSSIAEIQAAGAVVPLPQTRLIEPSGFTFSQTGNYINHAAPYYVLHAILGPSLVGQPQALIWHRLIDIVIAAIGLLLLFAAGRSLFPDDQELLIYAISIAAIPVLAPLAGSVNNDNLAFTAGALTLFGAERYHRRQGLGDLALAGLGVIIAGCAKLTALMLCGGFLAAFLALLWWRGPLRPAHIFLALAAFGVAALPAIDLWITYGSPAPNTPAQHSGLIEAARQAGWADQARLGRAAYAGRFLCDFVDGWMPVIVEKTALQRAMLALPLVTIALSIGGIFLSIRRVAEAAALELMVIAGALAIAATFAVHIVFSYERHLETGWLMDAYPRYYLPMIAIVPLAALVLLRATKQPGTHRALAAFLLVSPLAFRLLG